MNLSQKNTAAAILAASLFLEKLDLEATIFVAPSEHLIPDMYKFHEAISQGIPFAKDDKISTFGIVPTHAETGYGYLELSDKKLQNSDVSGVRCFIEKRKLADAQEYFESGNFLWNAGLFLFKARTIIEALRKYGSSSLSLVTEAVDSAVTDLDFCV